MVTEYFLSSEDCTHPETAREVWGMSQSRFLTQCNWCGKIFAERTFTFVELKRNADLLDLEDQEGGNNRED